MPIFRCFIRGENFPGALAGHPAPVGFYAARFVEAPSAQAAEAVALGLLRSESDFERVSPDDRMENARVYFEQIEEIDADGVQGPGRGFTFSPMEADGSLLP